MVGLFQIIPALEGRLVATARHFDFVLEELLPAEYCGVGRVAPEAVPWRSPSCDSMP
jgi:hypothetical protein